MRQRDDFEPLQAAAAIAGVVIGTLVCVQVIRFLVALAGGAP